MSKISEFIKNIRDHPFAVFIAKKFAFLLAAIVISMTLVFVLPRLMPQGPVDMMIAQVATGGGATGQIGETSPGSGAAGQLEIISRIYREKYAITGSYFDQYVRFWESFLTWDFGKSYAYQLRYTVSEIIGQRLPWTIALVLPIIPIGFVIGNWIGSRAAYYRGRLDKLIYYFSMYLWRAPYFWVAMVFMLLFGVELGWFPLNGGFSINYVGPQLGFDWFLDALHHYFLPFLSLIGVGIGGWAVGMRAMTLYEMESDYMIYAEQLGFSKGKLRAMAERNAILPNFTWIPMTLNMLVGQTLLVEVVFGYPGLGRVFYKATYARDYPLIQAGFLITLLLVLVGNFVADIIYGKLDPRIGTSYVGGE